jgi:hypothetical protein
MSDELCDTSKPERKCLTSWPAICDYYHKCLPNLKSHEDKGREPRWLFRGDHPCWLHLRGDEGHCPSRNTEPGNLCPLAEQGPGPLEPGHYDVLKKAFNSRLDKAFEEFGINDCQDRHEIEWGLMRAFHRKAHLYTGHRDDDWLERLGLIAHYEGPHRMLDWNYSFFNALYFAVNSSRRERDCIIWAINKRWLAEEARALEENILEKMQSTPDFREKVARMRDHRVCKPALFDTKAIHFLMLTNNISGIYPGTINQTWGENLNTALLKYPDQQPLVKIPIYLTTEKRNEVLRELHSMNISQATLFPDLGGFAQSLRTRLADPETISRKIPPLSSLEI